MTISDDGDRTRLVVETDRPAGEIRSFFLSAPERFVLDLPGARWAGPGAALGAGVALRRRYANRPEGAARLVLDLASPARLAGRRSEEGGRKLVFEFVRAGSEPSGAAETVLLGAGRVVVIDPGHGGRDPGAIGPGGVLEKDAALNAARALRASLEARGYEVALTRENDSFITLGERVAFARRRNADLFLSLHGDSSPTNRLAQGAAVYRLSERGARRSRAIMDSQNWQMDFGEAPKRGDVREILVDLTQRETADRSTVFAQSVIGALAAAQIPVHDRLARDAGFFVLLAPDVPAVLVEMGFLSHSADERRLADANAQRRLARALADAVDAYFAPARGGFAQAAAPRS